MRTFTDQLAQRFLHKLRYAGAGAPNESRQLGQIPAERRSQLLQQRLFKGLPRLKYITKR